MTGLIYNIQHYSIHDGPGIRTTVFLKGCPLRCLWCHNPESQEVGIEHTKVTRELDGKAFERKSAIGTRRSAAEVMDEISKDVVFYSESGGGVTFSGGEPMMQSHFVAEVLRLCRKKGVHTAIDTCGHAEPSAFQRVMNLTDLFLYDLKLMDDSKHVEYTGMSNELAIQNLEMIVAGKKNIIIRFPVIPGITDDIKNINSIIKLMKRLNLNKIDLLPYHSIARDKYKRLGKEFLLEEIKEPPEAEIKLIKQRFEKERIVTN